MKVTGLDGRVHNWNLTGLVPLGSETRPRSSYHLLARALLAEMFPLERRLEEVFLPGSGKLTLDFFIPGLKLAVEAHGEQHYGFTARFHKTRMDFLRGQDNDRKKLAWCELNGIDLRILPYCEEDRWRSLLS